MKTLNPIQTLTKDVCFQTIDKQRFRLRAAAIIIENEQILFATNDVETYYYSIGGAIQLQETAEEAVVREVLEETGVSYEVDRLAFVHENFFSRDDGMLKGLSCHEITFYFLMKPRGTQKLDSHSVTGDGKVKERMIWLPLNKLNEYEAYPLFFREKLKNLSAHPEHIVSIQD